MKGRVLVENGYCRRFNKVLPYIQLEIEVYNKSHPDEFLRKAQRIYFFCFLSFILRCAYVLLLLSSRSVDSLVVFFVVYNVLLKDLFI